MHSLVVAESVVLACTCLGACFKMSPIAQLQIRVAVHPCRSLPHVQCGFVALPCTARVSFLGSVRQVLTQALVGSTVEP